MKRLLLNLSFVVSLIGFTTKVTAQTAGTLTFTFTEVAKSASSCYNFNAQHDLAVWIQTSAGAFVKTKLRYVGGGTSDHLPTWASNASCTGGNAISTTCNTVDGITGATASAWKTYTVSWDGKKGAAATGTLQPDGVYKVTLQSTWNHGTTGTATTSYTFTKGPNVDHQTPAANTTFSNVTLDWTPNTTGVQEITKPEVSVYPNPTNGIFNVDFYNAKTIRVLNTLGVVVYEEKVDQISQGSKTIDLSKFSDGIYMISVANEGGSSNQRIILNK